MINLIELSDTLDDLRNEVIALGMPANVRYRVEDLANTIPNIETARERRNK